MFADILKNRLFIGALAIFIFCVGGSLLYMQHETQQGEKELAETQERLKQWNEKQKQPTAEVPEGDTAQGGHLHSDGTFHAEPHDAPVEVSESEVSPPVLAAPIVVQQADTQIDAATLESAERRLKDPEVYNAWVEWSKKAKELRNEYSQANRALINALPSTEEEQKRHDTDEQFRREIGLKVTEAGKEIGDVRRRMREHDKENPLLQ